MDESLRALPRAYSLALRLRDAGADEELIGDCLEVEATAVPVLLRLAEAKLRAASNGDAFAPRDPAEGPLYHQPR